MYIYGMSTNAGSSGGSRISDDSGARTYYLGRFILKMHENERNWTGGAPSLDPPMDKIQEICGSCTPEVEFEFIT